jgi:hypothetical protein
MNSQKVKSRIAGFHHDNGHDSVLDKVPGLKPEPENKWRWATVQHSAQVVAESDGAVRVTLDVAEPPPATVAVEVNSRLPGNLRFAACANRSLLLADTLLDGHAHLPKTFEQLIAGICLAVSGDPAVCPAEPLASEEVSAAMKDVDWLEQTVIELEGGWEFRPRVRGCAIPVNAFIDKSELKLYRAVITGLGQPVSYDSLCAQALRFNSQFKHARLAMSNGTLFAEARLHSEQLTPLWLETAAWAVAVADRHTRDILALLNESKEVADWYAESFLNGHESNRM